MSKAFAEKIIDSMVDENGHCGERGLSTKQFTIITDAMTDHTEEDKDAGYWQGDYSSINFWSVDHIGNVGKYHVTVNEHKHFNYGCNVVEISLRDEDEYQAELEEEARAEAERQRIRELLSFPNGQYKYEPKKRVDLELTLLRDYECEGYSYSYYDDGVFHIYTFADDEGNCFVWKTKNLVCAKDDYNWENPAEVGSKVTMRATIKEHSEYRGIKQNVITRPQIKEVA